MTRQLNRQLKRFNPSSDDPYFELNSELTIFLDSIATELKGLSCLDYGCGERPFQEFFDKYCFSVLACDINQNSSESVDFLLERSGALPFAGNKFDTIFLFDVLEHVENDDELIAELNRVLKISGHLVLSVPFMYRFHEAPYDFRRYTTSGIRSLLEHNGFEVKIITPLGSSFFAAFVMLRESPLNSNLLAKLIRILVLFLLRIPVRLPISSLSPFAYSVLAVKV